MREDPAQLHLARVSQLVIVRLEQVVPKGILQFPSVVRHDAERIPHEFTILEGKGFRPHVHTPSVKVDFSPEIVPPAPLIRRGRRHVRPHFSVRSIGGRYAIDDQERKHDSENKFGYVHERTPRVHRQAHVFLHRYTYELSMTRKENSAICLL